MLYIINNDILMQKGHVNAVIYKPEIKKILHVKNKLADMIIAGEPLTERVREFIGGEANVESSVDYLKTHPIQPQIDSIFVDLTNACNLKCKGCYSYQETNKRNISTDKLDVLSGLKRNPNTKLVLLGGEPLLYPKAKLKRYLKTWSGEFEHIIVFTNGYYFDNDWVDFFKLNNTHVRFTLYSFENDKHDNYVNHKGAFDSVIKAIQHSEKAGLQYKVNLILSGEEYINSETKSQALGLNASNIFVDLIRPTDNYTVEDYISVKKQKGELTRPIKNKSFHHAIRDSQYHSCYCGKVSVSVDGQVSQCPWEKKRPACHIEQFDMSCVEKEWKQPIQQTYQYCGTCEFSFLCFDCTDLNKKMGANSLRPINCSYNPFTGGLEC